MKITKRFYLYLEQNLSIVKYINKYYLLDKFIEKDKDILDIGGNRGNFSKIIKKFKSYTLVDPVNNCNYSNIINIKKGFEGFVPNKKYDVIFGFAVHNYISLNPQQYCSKILSLIKKNGLICLRSHKPPDKKFDEIIQILTNNENCQLVYQKQYKFIVERRLFYFRYI